MMVRVYRSANTVAVSRQRRVDAPLSKKVVPYSSGSVCFVLSPQDCSTLTQFYALLLTIDRRLAQKPKDAPGKGSEQNATNRFNKIKSTNQRKIKGSQISGPLLFCKGTCKGCRWGNFSITFLSF